MFFVIEIFRDAEDQPRVLVASQNFGFNFDNMDTQKNLCENVKHVKMLNMQQQHIANILLCGQLHFSVIATLEFNSNIYICVCTRPTR